MTDVGMLDRRALLRSAILLVGGAASGALPDLAWAQGTAEATAKRFLPQAQLRVLQELCGVIIPKTDTPGAREAGVPELIDALLAEWASPKTRAQLVGAIDDVEARSRADAGAGLAALPPAKQLAFVTAYDSAAMRGDNGGYRRLKDLILTGYYLSEPGATQELRYELAPGVWEPAVPVTAETRTWAV